MDPVNKIQDLLKSIPVSKKNNTDSILLNTIKNEFITFPGNIVIPRIEVHGLTYKQSVEIVEHLIEYIPEFLINHTLLEKRKPVADIHSLHLTKPLKGRVLDFIHFFKIDFRFGGDPSNIVKKGNNDTYPSYKTDRIYYKSRIVPSSISIDVFNDEFDSIRIFDQHYVGADQTFNTFAIFDELNTRKISQEIIKRLDIDVFSTSQELYPFIVYDFFSACFNVFYPTEAEINEALALFEPIFIAVYSKYKSFNELIQGDLLTKVKNEFSPELKFEEKSISFTPQFLEKLRSYFNRYKITRNSELTIKNWWKIEIDQGGNY